MKACFTLNGNSYLIELFVKNGFSAVVSKAVVKEDKVVRGKMVLSGTEDTFKDLLLELGKHLNSDFGLTEKEIAKIFEQFKSEQREFEVNDIKDRKIEDELNEKEED